VAGGSSATVESDRVLVVPRWLVGDWVEPAALALGAAGVTLVAQYAVGLVFALGVVVGAEAGQAVPWGDLFRVPILIWLGFHGGIAGISLTVTGLSWVAVGFLVAGNRLAKGSVRPEGTTALVVASLKTAVVYSLTVIVVAVVLAATSERLPAVFPAGLRPTALLPSFEANLAEAWPVAFLLSSILAAFLLFRRSGTRVTRPLELGWISEARLKSSWSASRRVLLYGVFGAAAFSYVASVVDWATLEFGPTGSTLLGLALTQLPTMLVWSVIDLGVVEFIEAMGFFAGEPAVVPSGKPLWVYLGVLVPVVAYFAGGIVAARARRPTDLVVSARVGWSVSLLVAPLLFLAALFQLDLEGGGLAVAALLLPVAWGLVAGAGGVYHARQAGLPTGFRIQVAAGSPALTPIPAVRTSTGAVQTCPECGTSCSPAAEYCHSCGSPLRGETDGDWPTPDLRAPSE
jgi:hypothetical protein